MLIFKSTPSRIRQRATNRERKKLEREAKLLTKLKSGRRSQLQICRHSGDFRALRTLVKSGRVVEVITMRGVRYTMADGPKGPTYGGPSEVGTDGQGVSITIP